MGSQPDFTVLSDGLANASQELRKFPNVPVINQGQEILTAINSLRTHMDQGFHDINDRIERVETRIERIETRIERVETRIESLETRLEAEPHNQIARLFNSHITIPRQEFQKVRNIHNQVPQAFPRDGTVLSTMRGPDLDSILRDYGIEPQRQLEAKKRQLKQFIGVVFQV